MKKQTKLLLILAIWVLLLSWLVRVFPHLGEPGMIGGYGVYHDWPRYSIVTTGTSQDISNAKTAIPNKLYGIQDLMTYLLASYTLISGETGVQSGLDLLLRLPNFTYFLPSLLAVSFYNRITSVRYTPDRILLFMMGLFISFPFIGYTTTSINKAGYGLCVLSLVIYVMFRISHSGLENRWLVIFVLVTGFMVSIYHTQGHVAIFLIPGYYALKFALYKVWGGTRFNDAQFHSRVSLSMFLLSSTILITVSMYYSGLVQELALNLVGIVSPTPNGNNAIVSAKTSRFITALSNLSDFSMIAETTSRVSKIALRFMYVLLIAFFFKIVSDRRGEKVRNEEAFLAILLLLFPIVFVMFFSYGGISIAIARTAATGSAVILFLVAYVVSRVEYTRKATIQMAMGAMVVLAIATQAGMIGEPQTYTEQEAAAIQFTGEKVPPSKIVFSEPAIGSPLLYYGHRGVVYIRLVYDEGWENRLRNVYFSNESNHVESAIIESIEVQQREKIGAEEKYKHYLLTTERLAERGISLETLSYPERPSQNFTNTFDRGYNRIYDSGDGILYRS